METIRRAKMRRHDDIVALLTSVGTCILGCVDTRGYPYQTPVNYEYAERGFYLVALEQPMWSQYVLRDGRVALYISNGSRRLLAQGHADNVSEPLFMRRVLERHTPRRTKAHEPADYTEYETDTMPGAPLNTLHKRQAAGASRPNDLVWFCVQRYDVFIQERNGWVRDTSRA